MNLSKPETGAPDPAQPAGCGPGLGALLAAAGPPSSVAGNTPFLLNQPDRCWWLSQGGIELFIVQTHRGSPVGMRRHFTSVWPGTLMFSIDDVFVDDSPDGYAVLAVPHVNTEVTGVAWRDVHALAAGAHAEDLSAPIDGWILSILEGLARRVVPGPVIHRTVCAGHTDELSINHRCASAQGVVWLDVPRDAALFLDTEELPWDGGACWFPLSPAGWLQSCRAWTVTARDSGWMLRNGHLWAGLETVHRVLLPTARLGQRLEHVDEHNRLRLRARAVEAGWRRSLAALQDVQGTAEAPWTDVGAADEPLVRAMLAIGAAEHFKVRLPARHGPAAEHGPVTLDDILDANRLRARRVRLAPGWARHDTQAMLGFTADEGQPMAILPQAGKSVRLRGAGADRRLSSDAAEQALSEEAYVFTAPLPPGALRWRALMRFVWDRARGDLAVLLWAILCCGALSLAVPISLAYVIDTVIPGHMEGMLWQIGGILGVLGITALVMAYVIGLALVRIQARAGPALQAAVVDRLLRLPVRFLRTFSTGDLASRADAISGIRRVMAAGAMEALIGCVFAVFSLGLLLHYDSRLGLWAVWLAALYILVSAGLATLQLRRERELADADGALHSLFLQLVSGAVKLRLAAAEVHAFARWAVLFARVRTLRVRAGRYGNLQSALNKVFGLGTLAIFFLLFDGGQALRDKNMLALGGLAAFLVAFGLFNASITQIAAALIRLLRALPLLERVSPLLSHAVETGEGREHPGALSGAVALRRVSFRYGPEGPLALDGISLSVQAGECLAIVGESGCGKSTLIRLLLGFEQPSSGDVLYDGNALRDLDLSAVRRQIGVVLQDGRPLPGTLYENIVATAGDGLDQAWAAAHVAGLAEDIARMPMGMHTVLTAAGTLSGGQMQRLMIARAVAARPRILLLDEATSALDNRTQAVVTANLDRLSVTRIVVAHRLSTVINAHRICVMSQGRIVEEGTYGELMSRRGAFFRLAATQLVG